MQTARSRSRPTESEPLGVGPAIWILTNPPELDAHSTLKNCYSNHDDLEPYSNPRELHVQPKGLLEVHQSQTHCSSSSTETVESQL